MMGPLLATVTPVIPQFHTASECATQNKTFCWDWFAANWGSIFGPALLQHVELVLIAVAAGFAISLMLGILTYRRPGWDIPLIVLGGFLYAVPAIAAFEILVPVVGLGLFAAELVLISYTFLVLYRAVLTGLRGVPPDVLNSAQGMGLTQLQVLLKIELPLAVPAIVAGLRIATVSTVSLATIAAYVFSDGLGAPIFDAMNHGNFKTELVGAGVLVVGLAVALDSLLVLSQYLVAPWSTRRGSRRGGSLTWRLRRSRPVTV
jgi:osmoprotectant transport system permease protein